MNVKYIKRDAEMDRIAEAFSGYIHRHPSLDLLWSDKAGYLILTINSKTQHVEEEENFLAAPALAYRLFCEIAMDVTLETGSGNRYHSEPGCRRCRQSARRGTTPGHG